MKLETNMGDFISMAKGKYHDSDFVRKQTEMVLSGKLSSRIALLRKKTEMQNKKEKESDL